MTASQENIPMIPIATEAANDASFEQQETSRQVNKFVNWLILPRLHVELIWAVQWVLSASAVTEDVRDKARLMRLARAQATQEAANDSAFSVEVVAPAANEGDLKKAA